MTYRTAEQARRDAAAIAGVVDGRDLAPFHLANHAMTMVDTFGIQSLHILTNYERFQQAKHLLLAACGTLEQGDLAEALIALARTDPSDHEAMANAYEAIRDAAAEAMNDETNRMMEGF